MSAPKQRRLRQKIRTEEEDVPEPSREEDDAAHRTKLEEVKLLQKLRKKVGGTNATTLGLGTTEEVKPVSEDPDDNPTELMGAFSKAKAVVTADEDPHMKKFVEQELAKRLGTDVNSRDNEDPETRRRRLEVEMYQIPEEYKSSLQGDFTVPGMTAIITEVNLSAAVRLQNIEANERKKRQMLGDDDLLQSKAEAKMKRNTCVPGFGKQPVKDRSRSREEMEAEAKRMRFMSERRPALPAHKLAKYQ